MLTVADLKARLAEFPDHWPVTVEVPPADDPDDRTPRLVDGIEHRKLGTENAVMIYTHLS